MLSSSSFVISEGLKKSLIQTESLLELCENYIPDNKQPGDLFLLSVISQHLGLNKFPPVELATYNKCFLHLLQFLSKDKVLSERLRLLCRIEIEEAFRDHEDTRTKKTIITELKLLIDLHAKLCIASGSPDAKL
jgi:hypothetical protein